MLGHSPQVITNGLLFYYDMGNPQKSWKGAPTINLLLQPLSPQTWAHERNSSFGFISDEFFTYNGSLGKNIPAYRRTLTGTDFRATRFDVPWTAHTQSNLSLPLTGSIYGRCLNPSSSTRVNINFQGTNSSGSRVDTNTSIEASSDWKLFSDTGTLSNNGFVSLVNFGMKYYMNGDSTPRTWEFMMPQVEQQPFATPFVNGTRSNTQVILDLVGNNTITANALTYNADGTFGFNGSNTYATIPNPITSSGPYSVMQWVRPGVALPDTTNSASRKTPLVGPEPVWNPGYWLTARVFRVHAATEYRDVTINWVGDTGWHQIGQIFDGTTCSTIIDGQVLLGTRTSYSIGTPTSMLIGAETTSGSSVNWNGDIGITTFYNRVLSAAEVQQNFNALRGRYGL